MIEDNVVATAAVRQSAARILWHIFISILAMLQRDYGLTCLDAGGTNSGDHSGRRLAEERAHISRLDHI